MSSVWCMIFFFGLTFDFLQMKLLLFLLFSVSPLLLYLLAWKNKRYVLPVEPAAVWLWLLHQFGHFTVSNYISISLSLSPRSFRLAWIAWFSQTLVWLVRSHPASSSFSCQSCDSCCGFVCCGSHLCCEITDIKYLSRRYFSSFLCVLYHS